MAHTVTVKRPEVTDAYSSIKVVIEAEGLQLHSTSHFIISSPSNTMYRDLLPHPRHNSFLVQSLMSSRPLLQRSPSEYLLRIQRVTIDCKRSFPRLAYVPPFDSLPPSLILQKEVLLDSHFDITSYKPTYKAQKGFFVAKSDEGSQHSHRPQTNSFRH